MWRVQARGVPRMQRRPLLHWCACCCRMQECLRVKRRVLFGAATLSVYGCTCLLPHTPVIASDSARVCIAGDFVSGTVSMRVQQLGALLEQRAAATSSVHTWRL
jgi:hypothetical protein